MHAFAIESGEVVAMGIQLFSGNARHACLGDLAVAV